jgi:hypothetical protein
MQKWPAGMDVGGGLKKTPQICSLVEIHKKEKRGVPRPHGNMLPWNSFPQICVVSIHIL